jgi:CBS domain-containing protein
MHICCDRGETMALHVGEVMNREVFLVREADHADETLAALIAMGLSAAPVVDAGRLPVGIVSWRDLVPPGPPTVGARMSRPVDCLLATHSLEVAAATLAGTRLHHAPVVDGEGQLIGFVSAIDVLAGLTGQPARHPPLFPHVDPATGVSWSDDRAFTDAHLHEAPDGPGVVAYVAGGRGRAEHLLFAEATHNVRVKLLDRLSEPFGNLMLRRIFDEGRLRYRTARIDDARERATVVSKLLETIHDHRFDPLPTTVWPASRRTSKAY